MKVLKFKLKCVSGQTGEQIQVRRRSLEKMREMKHRGSGSQWRGLVPQELCRQRKTKETSLLRGGGIRRKERRWEERRRGDFLLVLQGTPTLWGTRSPYKTTFVDSVHKERRHLQVNLGRTGVWRCLNDPGSPVWNYYHIFWISCIRGLAISFCNPVFIQRNFF